MVTHEPDILDTYDSLDLLDAIDQYDHIRSFVESDHAMQNHLRNDLFKLHSGIANLTGNTEYPRSELDLGALADEISDKMEEIIDAAKMIQDYLEPLLSLKKDEDDDVFET